MEVHLKRLISLLLVLSLTLSSLIYLSSCGGTTPPTNQDGNEENGGNAPEKPGEVIFSPEYKDYGRGTSDFSDLVYTRPNIAAIIAEAEAIDALISGKDESFDAIAARVEALDDLVSDMFTMRALAEIYTSRDSSIEFWRGESEYISVNYPKYLKAVKDMMVSAANSDDAERYESEVFGEGLIEKYRGGSDYTDEVVALLSEEARLEAIYSGYSTATVVIKDELTGAEGTVDELIAAAKSTYGENSQSFKRKEAYYITLYDTKVQSLSSELFVELVKVRRQIADELSLSSYSEFAYREMGYEYSVDEMERLLSEIKSSILPVYSSLYTQAFRPTRQGTLSNAMDRVALINTLYKAYSRADAELGEIYSYMLQHKLYDIESSSANRFDGAFTVYIDSNSSPFIFMSTSGYTTDLATLSHEFGHFADNYLNDGASASLDTLEVSSQALELLTLTLLKNEIPQEQYRYLVYSALASSLETLIYQGFYSAVEHQVYKITYDNISLESINDAVKEVSLSIFGMDDYDNIKYAMIPHLILYPHYVQSYCTSVIPSLEIFFTETADGSGFEVYKALITRENDLEFTDYLSEAGLSSPFESGVLKMIADEMHYYVLGSHYFKSSEDDCCNAA